MFLEDCIPGMHLKLTIEGSEIRMKNSSSKMWRGASTTSMVSSAPSTASSDEVATSDKII